MLLFLVPFERSMICCILDCLGLTGLKLNCLNSPGPNFSPPISLWEIIVFSSLGDVKEIIFGNSDVQILINKSYMNDTYTDTPPKINMDTKHDGLENVFPFKMVIFQIFSVSIR